jgi:NitT/TauT family transport system permease protein
MKKLHWAKSLGLKAGFFFLLFFGWWLLAERKIWDPTLFPSPFEVAKTLGKMIADGSLADATAVSLRRVLLGYSISLAIGIPLGILLARVSVLEQTFGSLVVGAQALPSICWLPLALLWFGLNDRAILFVVIMGSLVSITVTVQDGVKNLPSTYVRAARTMGTKPWKIYRDVLLPAALPSILTGAKLGWSYAWRALMAGELLFVSSGLGQQLYMGRELADMGVVLSVMLAIVFLGLFADTVIFGALERRVRARFGFGLA